jgi:hypothetical protein
MKDHDQSRRDFIKKVAYTAPAIMTLRAMPAFAKNGSTCTTSYDWSKDSNTDWSYKSSWDSWWSDGSN